MRDKMFKKYQHKMNKIVRDINRNIYHDELWKGRFELRQKDAYFEKFSDGSGGVLVTTIRAYDKQTCSYEDYVVNISDAIENFTRYNLFLNINTFIVNDLKVWNVLERPSKETSINYRKISIPESVMRKPHSYEVLCK